MILVDTSIWIDHLRRGDALLEMRLTAALVLCHPFVVGELALGNLRQRKQVLPALSNLPQANIATEDEVLGLIDRQGLHGRGLGLVDVHLLAAARLTPGCTLWTRDRRLARAAQAMGLSTDR